MKKLAIQLVPGDKFGNFVVAETPVALGGHGRLWWKHNMIYVKGYSYQGLSTYDSHRYLPSLQTIDCEELK